MRKLSLAMILLGVFSQLLHGRNISWFSDFGKVNQDSNSALMTGEFRFELGVFDAGFAPTAANVQLWATHWNVAQRVKYNQQNKRFDGFFTVTGNTSPFIAGTSAYVWGFRGAGATGQWILFRAASWTWPVADPFEPIPVEWDADQATAVVGTIDADGSPFLMSSAAVTNALPPETYWIQWQQEELAGVMLNQPTEDPDQDGISNLLEFVFGTSPVTFNPPVPQTFNLMANHPTLTIARRPDRPATLIVEVSNNLSHWQSGPEYTQVVSNTIDALVVRDLAILAPDTPKRFMRVRVDLP